jgi:hypothetical protein
MIVRALGWYRLVIWVAVLAMLVASWGSVLLR